MLTGVGKSIESTRRGVQSASFRPVAGSAEVCAGIHCFGFFSGRVTADGKGGVAAMARSKGVAEYTCDRRGTWRYCTVSGGDKLLQPGSVVALDEGYKAERAVTQLPVADNNLSPSDGDGTAARPFQLEMRVPPRFYRLQFVVLPSTSVKENNPSTEGKRRDNPKGGSEAEK